MAAGEQISAYKTAGVNEKKQKTIITVITVRYLILQLHQ